MKPSRPDFNRLRGAISKAPSGAGRGLWALLTELVSILREMLRIPAQIFMRVAESAGALVLLGWQILWPLLVRAWRGLIALERVLERQVTPLRATAGVALAAALALGLSQFADYSHITIGSEQYTGVSSVAPAPVVESTRTGEAHAWVGLLLAAGAVGVLAACALGGRWRLATALVPIGLVAILVGLIVDMPKGLDEGDTSVTYEGATAVLLGGFWAQLAAGAVLIAVAPLLLAYSRGETAGAARPARERAGRRSSRGRRAVAGPIRGART